MPSQIQVLQQQVAALTAANAQLALDKQALEAKIAAAKLAAQADKDADAANVAGQGVLDALA